jgi:hypothetical protein
MGNPTKGAAMKRIAWTAATLIALSFPLGAQALNKKLTSRSYMDARHCLDLPTTTQVIICAERYM